MDTISGDLDSRLDSRREDAAGRRVLVVGQGGPIVSLRSTSGDLRVDDERIVLALRGRRPDPVATPAAADPTGRAAPRAPARSTADEGDDLEILRALERGEIDTGEAGRRLAALDDVPVATERDDV